MEFVKKTISRNDMLAVLKIRPFSFMMISEFFSQFAFNMQHFVLIFIVFELTHSNTAVSGIILSFTIPAVLFSLITGVFVDRWNKKNILFLTNVLRGIFLIPFFLPNLHVGFIYTFTFLIAVATQFFLPAESAIIPSLVPKKLLFSANAVFSLGIYSATLIGYMFSGPILLLLGKTNTFVFLAILFFISAFFITLISIHKKNKIKVPDHQIAPSLAHETREIFSFIRKTRKVMYALTMLTIAQAVIFMFAVLSPGYATDILKVQLESLSWIIIAPAAVGMGGGAVILGSIGKKFNRKWLSSLGFLLAGASFIIFPFLNQVTSYGFVEFLNKILPLFLNITSLHIVVIMAAVMGFAISLVFIPSNTTIQIETDESMRGRVYGLLNALIGAVSFLPVVLAGGLADILGVSTVIIGFGIVLLLIGIFFLAFE